MLLPVLLTPAASRKKRIALTAQGWQKGLMYGENRLANKVATFRCPFIPRSVTVLRAYLIWRNQSMNPGATQTIDATQNSHCIASNRSMATLLAWATEYSAEQAVLGRRVLWAPCQALAGAVTLRTWIIDRAAAMLGGAAPHDAATLIGGSADVLIIADPASADATSLDWLGEMLASASIASEFNGGAPLPEIVVLIQSRGGQNKHLDSFLERLKMLGAREVRVAGKAAGSPAIKGGLEGLATRHLELGQTLALMPCPVDLAEFEALAAMTKTGAGARRALLDTGLFAELGGMVAVTSREVRDAILEGMDDRAATAETLLQALGSRLDILPGAKIEMLLASGDYRRAQRPAKRCFEEYYATERYEEALRILELLRRAGLTLDNVRYANEIDEARLVSLAAEVGQYERARSGVEELSKRRDLYRVPLFVEWLALAARTLAIQVGHEPRAADSLLRRAIRLASDDTDRSVRLTLLRVALLRSRVFKLEERSTWLLSHVNNAMLQDVSKETKAAYLDLTADKLVEEGEYKAAFKRLRRLGGLGGSDRRMARAMLNMARCRLHFDDLEGALRYASSAIHYGTRAPALRVVEEAARMLRDTRRGRQGQAPRITPPKGRGDRVRLPAVAEIPTPRTPESARLFGILESRFGAVLWIRRRGGHVQEFGKGSKTETADIAVFQDMGEGKVRRLAGSESRTGNRGVVLLRPSGDDFVLCGPAADGGSREDSIVRLLLVDGATSVEAEHAGAPPRKAVIDEYLRRAAAQTGRRSLHGRVVRQFNKDLLIYMEEQGLTKEEIAEKLGVSRATLYRMFARAGLN